MLRTTRTRRTTPLRRTLTLEALEDRTLLSGPSGAVTASLNLIVPNGILTIQGDTGNNNIAIGSSPVAGNIRVSGKSFTSVNGVSFTDFPLAAITSINVSFLSGQDTLSVAGISIPGNLTINAGNGANTFTISNFTSNQVNLSAGNGGNAISLTSVRTGGTILSTGAGKDVISLTGVTVSTALISSGTNDDTITVNGLAVGNLTISAGAPAALVNDTVSVTGTRIARATISVLGVAHDGGAERVTVSNDTFTGNPAVTPTGSPPNPTVPGSLNLIVGQTGFAVTDSTYQVTLASDVFNTGAPNVLNNGSLRVTVGDARAAQTSTTPATLASTLTLSQLSGINDATITAGHDLDTVSLDGLTTRSLNVSVGACDNTFRLTNTTVAGPANVSLGDNANNVTLNNVLTSVTPIDLSLGRLADLNFSLGNNAGTVALTGLNVGRNLTITNGNGNTMFTISNVAVGQDLSFGATAGKNNNGNQVLMLDTVKVLDQLFMTLGTGVNGVSAHNTTALFGQIVAGGGASPNSNVYWDQGGNSGFFVSGFDNFLTGSP